MQIRKTSKSVLFILELVIILLFFSFTGAICMRLFAHSAILSEQSSQITLGSIKAQSIAEVIKATKGDTQKLTSILGGELKENTISIGYTEDFEENTSLSSAVYIVDVIFTEKDDILYADILVKEQEEIIFSLETACSLNENIKGARQNG